MSRNNDERFGAQNIHSEPPPQIIDQFPQKQTDSLAFVVPAEFVELPSKGFYYPEGHPLHHQECVEIKHMTAKEEDILADQALLKKGLAIDRFLKSVIIDKSIKLDSLLVGDKNAILIAARITGYGANYDTKIVCPVCFSHGRHEFDLEEARKVSGNADLEELGIERGGNGTFFVTLPKTGFQVECRLVTGKQEKTLLNSAEKRKKQKLPSAELTSLLRAIVVSVNGIEDKMQVSSFIENMPASDSRFLRNTYRKFVPNVELRQTYACGACEAETDITVPFTTDFFWPNT